MNSASTGDLNRIVTRATWRFVPFLMLCYVVAYLDRVNVGFVKNHLQHDIGVTATQFGFGAGIFFIGYFFFEVPSNVLLQKFGARKWISRIMISWALVSAACALTNNAMTFYVLRFLLGVCEAGFFPGIVLFLTQWFPAFRRAQIIAIFMSAIPMAGLVGAPLSAWIIEAFDGTGGIEGWRWMFALEAIPALLLGLLVLIVLDSRITEARWLSTGEKALLQGALDAEAAEVPASGHAGAGIRGTLTDRRVLFFAAVYFCCIMGQYGVTFWLPTLIDQARGGIGGGLALGLLGAVPYLLALIAMITVGRHSDRTGERRLHTAIPMAIGGLALLLLPGLSHSLPLSMIAMSIAAAGILTTTPLFWTLPTRVLPPAMLVVALAAINSVGNLAGFLSPVLIGSLTDATGTMAWGLFAIAAFLVLGCLLVLFMRADRGRAGTAA